MNLMIVVMIIVGAVIVYAAVKGQDPRSIIKQAIRGH